MFPRASKCDMQHRRRIPFGFVCGLTALAAVLSAFVFIGAYRALMHAHKPGYISQPAATAVPSRRDKGFYDQFAIVFIDRKTEAQIGPFPYDRLFYATAIDHATQAGARSVALNLSIDRSRNETNDHILAHSIAQSRVILAAALDDQEKSPNELPAGGTGG